MFEHIVIYNIIKMLNYVNKIHIKNVYKMLSFNFYVKVCESGIEGDLARSEFNKSMKTSLECISLVYKGLLLIAKYFLNVH